LWSSIRDGKGVEISKGSWKLNKFDSVKSLRREAQGAKRNAIVKWKT
jgi:hypothetical protein